MEQKFYIFFSQFLIIVDQSFPKNELSQELMNISPSTSLKFFMCNLSLGFKEIHFTFSEIFQQCTAVDVLINCIGIFNESLIDLTIQMNLIAPIHTSTIMLEHWDKRRGGSGGLLINVTSVAGLSPIPGIPVYCASKAGVVAFTKSLAVRRKIVY